MNVLFVGNRISCNCTRFDGNYYWLKCSVLAMKLFSQPFKVEKARFLYFIFLEYVEMITRCLYHFLELTSIISMGILKDLSSRNLNK